MAARTAGMDRNEELTSLSTYVFTAHSDLLFCAVYKYSYLLTYGFYTV